MRRSLTLAAVLVGVVLVLATPLPRTALVDDFEDDFWLPFTHFHLGDRASAGYSALLARGGAPSDPGEIHGWPVRGCCPPYGLPLLAPGGAPPATLVHLPICLPPPRACTSTWFPARGRSISPRAWPPSAP